MVVFLLKCSADWSAEEQQTDFQYILWTKRNKKKWHSYNEKATSGISVVEFKERHGSVDWVYQILATLLQWEKRVGDSKL